MNLENIMGFPGGSGFALVRLRKEISTFCVSQFYARVKEDPCLRWTKR